MENSLFFILIINIFIIPIQGEIINNPIKISDNPNPIILQSETEYAVITSGEKTIIDKETGIILSKTIFINYNKPYVLCTDQSNNDFIFSQNNPNNTYYKISWNNSHEISLPSINYPNNDYYVGYMKESEYENITTDFIQKCEIPKNEIIIYGRKNTKFISFSFIVKQMHFEIDSGCSIKDKISCKRGDNAEYICAVACNEKIIVYLSVLEDTEFPLNSCVITYQSFYIENLASHMNPFLLDTDVLTQKILCATNKDTLYIECTNINYNVGVRKVNSIQYEHVLTLEYEVNDIGVIPMEISNNADCVYFLFLSEILFCCGGTNVIKCARLESNLNFKNYFSLNIPGENTYLNIIYSSSNFTTIFYMNSQSSIEKTYAYYIYVPDCSNQNYTIITYHSINEDKIGNEENINDFFTRNTNTKYYIEFDGIPEEYGDLTINNEIINFNTSKILINENESNIFDFISTNNKIVTNHEISYTISIDETYSAQCKIFLSILSCYTSCEKCSKDISLSNSEEHNCLVGGCKGGYYPDPTKNTNCFTLQEKKSNWYFDYVEMKFVLCDETCPTCDGPTNQNCLSCKSYSIDPSHSFLYNKQCIDRCPDGTYKESKSGGYYKCTPCFINCKTCSTSGNSNNMNCDSCEINDIHYQKKCFKEYDSHTKSFYLPESSEISSCYELINYYIQENTYECVSSIPQYGYYLSNPITGVFSRCHEDCKTCSTNYTETNSNCDICLNQNYHYFKGNCIENCPDGYYTYENNYANNKKLCRECYLKCSKCNSGIIYSGGLISNMSCIYCKKEVDHNNSTNIIDKYIQVDGNCYPIITYTNDKITFNVSETSRGESEKSCLSLGKSIFYGEYKCIIKPENTFFVIDNENNTGIIEYCDEACSSCYGEKDIITQNTNCKNCSNGFFKTEDSNTTCILQNLIPENYYKNINNNIYYHCYINCKKCSDYYDIGTNNMNCLECIDNYYFVYNTNNCYNMSFIENSSYYFSTADNKFHKCHLGCEICLNGNNNEYNQNCIKCQDNYYFEENTNNCYNITYLEKGYYLDNFTINSGELPIFKKCYRNCQKCNNSLIGTNMNCELCKINYYKINGTNNCFTLSLLNQGYYLKDNLFFPCEENCVTCSNSKTIINDTISYNCLSCDKINKGLYLVNELNYCESIDYKNNGYYLQEDLNGIEIFYKCYKTCSLCDKGKEFDNNTNQDNHNCLECSVNNYKFKEDLNSKNCYGNEMIELGYSLVNNLWQVCHKNCMTCLDKPIYNEFHELVSQNCLICIEGFFIIYQTKNCENDSVLENGYYFDDNDSKYHKCNIQCKTCEKYRTEINPKCLSCNYKQGYFPAENKPTSKCYNAMSIENRYSLYKIYNEDNEIIYGKWIICHSTCVTCFAPGNSSIHNCLTCISNYYLLYNTTNCVTNEYASLNGYYLNITLGLFVKCDNACIRCYLGPVDDNTNCIECNEDEGYYPIVGNDSMCFNNETIKEGYFLDIFQMPYK